MAARPLFTMKNEVARLSGLYTCCSILSGARLNSARNVGRGVGRGVGAGVGIADGSADGGADGSADDDADT